MYADSVYYPMHHELQREYGLRMKAYGMVMTAKQLFMKLRMYEEAVDCLI